MRAEPGIRYDAQHWALAAITVQDNRILWQRSEIGARAHLTGELLRVSSDAIPVAVFRPTARQVGEPLGAPGQRNRGGETGTIGLVELTIVDKATGETIGETVAALVPGGTRANRILDVQVWRGQVVVTAGSRTLRFPVGDRKTAGPRAGGRRADAWATENGVGGD